MTIFHIATERQDGGSLCGTLGYLHGQRTGTLLWSVVLPPPGSSAPVAVEFFPGSKGSSEAARFAPAYLAAELMRTLLARC